MKAQKYFLNTALTAVLFLILLAVILVRTFAPGVILPQADVPNLVLVSLLPLLIGHYAAPCARRCDFSTAVLAALAFGLLPYGANLVSLPGALGLGASGGLVFTVTTALFSSMVERLSSGPGAKAAPALSALGLYLAAQCLMGFSL